VQKKKLNIQFKFNEHAFLLWIMHKLKKYKNKD